MDDKHILARARRGELDAFEELVRRYEKRVYVIALRSSGNPEDAADITQEVFLRAWRSIENFRGDSGFSTWLFRITMNICVDHARHRQAQPQTTTLTTEDDEERPIHDTAPTPEEQLDNRELGRELAEQDYAPDHLSENAYPQAQTAHTGRFHHIRPVPCHDPGYQKSKNEISFGTAEPKKPHQDQECQSSDEEQAFSTEEF